jgi:hypothetical protein
MILCINSFLSVFVKQGNKNAAVFFQDALVLIFSACSVENVKEMLTAKKTSKRI